jgi:hypothetical protein
VRSRYLAFLVWREVLTALASRVVDAFGALQSVVETQVEGASQPSRRVQLFLTSAGARERYCGRYSINTY